jgi:carbonic anhydrase/acetyltransferase-like protein (isoleucine patch superfamily)
MDNIIRYKEKIPKIEKDVYINPFAIVIGDVTIHSGSSIWPGVIVRADEDKIVIGENVALLDGVLIESPHGFAVHIGKNVLVSHKVTLHGCIIKDNVLIGISANILEGAEVGECSVIGASTLIPPGVKIPPYSKVMGVPGKIIGKVTENELKEFQNRHEKIKNKAKEYGNWFVTKQI